MKKAKQFLLNTFLLTATSLLMRAVGVSYQVYLSRKIGSTGIGLFTLLMSMYSLAVTFAISGIRLATTRLVAEELGRGQKAGAKKAMYSCMAYGLFFGCLSGGMLFVLAPTVGFGWLGDARTVLPLQVLSLSLPFLALSAVLGGYFTAVRRVIKNAAAGVFEQFLKITFTVVGLSFFLPADLEIACVVIVAGSVAGELLSCALLFILWRLDSKKALAHGGGKAEKGIPKRMLGIALPVAVSAYARSGLSTLEHLLVPRGLRRSGLSPENALTAYGAVHGMVIPIILFPSAVLYTVAELLVPELAECRAQGNRERQNRIIGRVFQGAFLFSICVTGLLYTYSRELGLLLYNKEEIGYFIRILAPLVPAIYLDAAVDGMLKGLGEQLSSMRYNIFDSLTGIALTVLLLPRFAIDGYLITIFVTEILNFTLSARRLLKVTEFRLSIGNLLLKPCLCMGLALVIGRQVLPLLGAGGSWGLVLSQMGLIGGFYILLLFGAGSLTGEDKRWFTALFR